METDYLADIQQSLLGGNPTLRVECMISCNGLKTLKICKKQAEWSSPVIKYSPGQFTLITITSDSSLSVVRLSHTEEVIEEVDFKVDLGQPPDSALVEFISNSLIRKVDRKFLIWIRTYIHRCSYVMALKSKLCYYQAYSVHKC